MFVTAPVKSIKPSPQHMAQTGDQFNNAGQLATFPRRGNGWICKAWGLQAVAFGSSKPEAQSNFAMMLVLVRASGVGIARAPRHRANRFKTKANQA